MHKIVISDTSCLILFHKIGELDLLRKVYDSVSTTPEIAQEFSVHPTQVGEWKKALLAQAPGIFDGKRGPKPDDPSASPERLYSEIGRLKMELDWLKKKSGIGQ